MGEAGRAFADHIKYVEPLEMLSHCFSAAGATVGANAFVKLHR